MNHTDFAKVRQQLLEDKWRLSVQIEIVDRLLAMMDEEPNTAQAIDLMMKKYGHVGGC